MNLLLLSIFFSTLSFAQVEQKQVYDINSDGIKDRFEYSIDTKLIRIEEDRDGNGKIDFITILNDKEFSRIEMQDQQGNGKFDRKQSFKLIEGNKTKLTTEVDKDGDGKYEINYSTISNNDQKQENCDLIVNQKIEDLTKSTLKAISKTQLGFLPSGLGYKIDHACYTKWGYDFNKIVKDSALGGLKCLKDLDKKGKLGTQQTGAIRNAFNLSKQFEGDKISLVCSEDQKEDYDWSATMAHASTDSKDELKRMKVKHPFVSINPNYPEHKSGTDLQAEIKELKSTIFHETMHTLGIRHDESVEYPYTCEKCCFDDKASPELKEVACRVCTGNYKNESDKSYVKDFIEYSKLSYDEIRGIKSAQKYLKEHPKDPSALAMLSLAESGSFNPIGVELAKIIEEKKLALKDPQDIIQLEIIKSSNSPERFSESKRSSKVIAQALFELYYNKDGAAASKILFDNRWLIKTEIKKNDDSKNDEKKLVGGDLRSALSAVVNDMWLNNYPDKATSDKAYELYDYFKPVPAK